MKNHPVAWLVGALAAATVVVGGIVGLRVFVLNPYRIPSASMEPTILSGTVVWAYKLAYFKPGDVRRGDLIFHRTNFEGKSEVYVKRVIGLPGDRVKTKGRVVVVNGMELTQQLVREEGRYSVFVEKQGEVAYQIALQLAPPPQWQTPDVDLIVPDGAFFLLGDNRMRSRDSRYIGCVRWPDVVGEAIWAGQPNS